MSLDQLQMIEGTALLELRTDKLFQQCGLPLGIVDTAAAQEPRQTVRWAGTEMKLSSTDWEIIYSHRPERAHHENAWINPGTGSIACLPGLSELILHVKGEVGILSVKKRTDNPGYHTSYDVPIDLYAAHQVIGLTGTWKRGVPLSRIQKQYGKPDEILNKKGGIKYYRYWVIAKQKEMPISVHAVDFEVRNSKMICLKYTVHTNGALFVQEKFDALQREWEAQFYD